MERYYFTVRYREPHELPVNPVAIKRLKTRQDMPGFGPVYGWADFEKALDYDTVVQFGLLRAVASLENPCYDPSLWERKYKDKNIRQRGRGEMIRVAHGYSDLWENFSYAELEYSIEMYRRTATLILQKEKTWCVLYAVKHHDGDKISSCDLMFRKFATAEEYYEFMHDTGSDLVYTAYRRDKNDGKS